MVRDYFPQFGFSLTILNLMKTPFHSCPVTVGEFFRHEYISVAGFEAWDRLPLAAAWEDPSFVGRLLRTNVEHPALLRALLDSAPARHVARTVLQEPDVARMARLAPVGSIVEDRRDLTGPSYLVATGPAVGCRGQSDDELAMAVEGFDTHVVLAPTCTDAVLHMRAAMDRGPNYFRLATNQYDLNRLALRLRLVTLGYVDADDPASV